MWSWVLAYRNLGRNKRRSIATGLAIGAGFIGMVLVSAYLYRANRALQASTVYLNHKGHLALFKKNSLTEFTYRPKRFLISKEEQDKIASIILEIGSDIEFTGRYLTGTGLISNQNKSTPFVATAVEPEVYKRILAHPLVHRWTPDWVFSETLRTTDSFIKNPQAVSITESMALYIGKHYPFDQYVGDDKTIQLIGKSYFGDLNAIDAELELRHTTGMAMAEDTSLYISLAQLQALYATDGIQYWAFFLKDLSSLPRVKQVLVKKLKEQNLDIDVFPFYDDDWGAYYVGSVGFLFVIACLFVLLICGAVVLSVVNTTTLGIFERYREIGTLRATGFPPKTIYSLFWKENLILSIISLFVGYVLAEWIAQGVNAADITFHPPGTQGDIQFRLETNLQFTLILGSIVILINFVSTMAAVQRSTRTSIVNLLTSSGG